LHATPISEQHEGSSATPRWRLDPAGSKAEFRVPHFWGLITVKGHFDRLDGWLDVDESGRRRMELTIDAASLHTGNPMRDRHLRGADFFDVQPNPEVRFRSTTVDSAGERTLRVQGELEMAGHRVALTLQPIIEQNDDQLEIDVRTPLDQRRFDMTWSPLGMTRTPVMLHVHALLLRER
jgi:polyisoprenoid-binding protein YceI